MLGQNAAAISIIWLSSLRSWPTRYWSGKCSAQPDLTTDQKVGGSDPSERAEQEVGQDRRFRSDVQGRPSRQRSCTYRLRRTPAMGSREPGGSTRVTIGLSQADASARQGAFALVQVDRPFFEVAHELGPNPEEILTKWAEMPTPGLWHTAAGRSPSMRQVAALR